jgi:hypothetical protein
VSDSRDERAERAAARASWPIRHFALGEEPNEDLRDSTTPEQRLGMMWELAVQAWTLSGRPLPTYERWEAPGLVRRAE